MINYSITIQTEHDRITVKTDGSLSISQIFATAGLNLPTPCGNMGMCGKCRVRVAGEVYGDTPDENHTVRACLSYPRSDLDILAPAGVTRKDASPSLTVHTVDARNGSPDKDTVTGLAFDIGTTTLVGSIVAHRTDAPPVPLATVSVKNPQSVYGFDVLSRVSASDAHLYDMQTSLLNALTEMANTLAAYQKAAPTDAVFTGNTVMLHILCGISPKSIGQFPYTPVFRNARPLPTPFAGISRESTYVFPTASGFIGGDLLAGILLYCDTREPTLIVDLGTNCEIALIIPNEKGTLPTVYATSAAAGPAMEGGNLTCGMGALPGAISSVSFDGYTLKCETIGELTPRGICGSGLFDIIAILCRYGAIDQDGMLTDEEIPEALSRRMTEISGKNAFLLAENVYLTQGDIRSFQLAKSAVRCGIELLSETAQIDADAIQTILSGAFGTYINCESARTAGLFPKDLTKRVISAGNTALIGASRCLFRSENKEKIEAIAKDIRVLELERTENFEKRFFSHLSFKDS